MPAQDHIEGTGRQVWSRCISHDEPDAPPGFLSCPLQHARRDIKSRHVMAEFVQQKAQRACSATKVSDAPRRVA
jgi:hypothetical protein